MPYRLVLAPDLLTVEFSGSLTRDVLFSALLEMEAIEQRQSTAPDRLYLLVDVLEWHIAGDDIRRHQLRRRETCLPNPIRSAIVVERRSHAAVARVFELYSHDLPQIDVRVFTTLEDAREWLGLF
jgi:hypothetical protein